MGWDYGESRAGLIETRKRQRWESSRFFYGLLEYLGVRKGGWEDGIDVGGSEAPRIRRRSKLTRN